MVIKLNNSRTHSGAAVLLSIMSFNSAKAIKKPNVLFILIWLHRFELYGQ